MTRIRETFYWENDVKKGYDAIIEDFLTIKNKSNKRLFEKVITEHRHKLIEKILGHILETPLSKSLRALTPKELQELMDLR